MRYELVNDFLNSTLVFCGQQCRMLSEGVKQNTVYCLFKSQWPEASNNDVEVYHDFENRSPNWPLDKILFPSTHEFPLWKHWL